MGIHCPLSDGWFTHLLVYQIGCWCILHGMTRVYLDWNATAPLHPHIADRMSGLWQQYANPSSAHYEGRSVRVAIETARTALSDLTGFPREGIWFGGSGSELNTQWLYSLGVMAQSTTDPIHLIVSAIEHPCVQRAAQWVRSMGVQVSECPVDSFGILDMAALAELLTPATRLVSVMMVNNELGVRQPVEAISEMVRSYGAWFHSDVVQAVGKTPIEWSCFDMVTMAPHKCGGPKGVAIGCGRIPGFPQPLIQGGGQENGWRSGTECMPLIVAGTEAVIMALTQSMVAHLPPLKTQLEQIILDYGGVLVAPHSLPSTVAAYFHGYKGDAVVRRLDMDGIAISAGSACSTGSIEPSHVVKAIGLSPEAQWGVFRMSMGWGTTSQDIAYLREVLTQWHP